MVFRVPEGPAVREACGAVLRRRRRLAREPSTPRASLGASARCPARPCRRSRAPQPGPPAASALALGGFLHEAFWWRVADVSDPRVAKFFSFGGGEVVVSGSAVHKVQTTSVKNVENGVLWVRWSAFWAQRCLA